MRARLAVAGIFVFMMATCPRQALAGNNEEARSLADKAMNEHYLNVQFKQAKRVLSKALMLCSSGCSGATRARLHGDLATVLFIGLSDPAGARKHITEALKADKSYRPRGEFLSKELKRAWIEAGADLSGTGEDAGETRAVPKSSKLSHQPVERQAIRTALPMHVTVSQGVQAHKIYVHYRSMGMTAFKKRALTRLAARSYGIEIACEEVGTITGLLKYYFEVVDEGGSVITLLGSPDNAFGTEIVQRLDGDEPHLPGKPPPSQCVDTADCPPDFPGCETFGANCDSDGDCGDGMMCQSGSCQSDAATVGDAPQNWFSIAFQQDFMFFGSSADICSGGNQYFCYYNDDSYYTGLPYGADGNEVAGGIGLANQRLMVGYDRSLVDMFTLGVRAGFSFSGGPETPAGATFLPLYAEGRFAYHFLDNPFGRTGLVPFVFLSGGFAQSDARLLVTVYDGDDAYMRDERTKLNAWRKTGSGFVSVGGGAAIKFTDWTGLSLDLRAMQLFPTAATGMSGRVGYFAGI